MNFYFQIINISLYVYNLLESRLPIEIERKKRRVRKLNGHYFAIHLIFWRIHSQHQKKYTRFMNRSSRKMWKCVVVSCSHNKSDQKYVVFDCVYNIRAKIHHWWVGLCFFFLFQLTKLNEDSEDQLNSLILINWHGKRDDPLHFVVLAALFSANLSNFVIIVSSYYGPKVTKNRL